MMNINEKKNILDTKKDEVEALYKEISKENGHYNKNIYKELGELTEKQQRNLISNLYEEKAKISYMYDQQRGIQIIIEFLRATDVFKYMELAKIMDSFLRINLTNRENEISLQQAQLVMTSVFDYECEIKTVYKEFEKIRKRALRFDKLQRKKLKKYKDIEQFMTNHIDEFETSVFEFLSRKELYVYSIPRMSDDEFAQFLSQVSRIVKENREEVIEDLMINPQLNSLINKSEISKKIL